jgi:ABC-type multidrug transport system fused ATPase/permease subunit
VWGRATVVLVLVHGQVVEQGSPAELIRRTGSRYAALHRALAVAGLSYPVTEWRSGSR